MKIKLSEINFKIFFLEQYIAAFAIMLIGIIIFSSAVFYVALKKSNSAPKTETIKNFDMALITKANELLDIRERYFTELRSIKPSIKNPF